MYRHKQIDTKIHTQVDTYTLQVSPGEEGLQSSTVSGLWKFVFYSKATSQHSPNLSDSKAAHGVEIQGTEKCSRADSLCGISSDILPPTAPQGVVCADSGLPCACAAGAGTPTLHTAAVSKGRGLRPHTAARCVGPSLGI